MWLLLCLWMLVDGRDSGHLEFYRGNTALTSEQSRSPVAEGTAKERERNGIWKCSFVLTPFLNRRARLIRWSYSKVEIFLRHEMVIGLSQNKTKNINSAEHPVSKNNISRSTNNLRFFVDPSLSAGEHPLVKKSGALQGYEIFIYVVDIDSVFVFSTDESFPIHWNRVVHFHTCCVKNLLTFLALSPFLNCFINVYAYSYFEKGCRKNVHTTISKGVMGYDQYTVYVAVEPSFAVLF